MPPKVRITREGIINAAIDMIRKNGVEALNARSLAAALQCSTQPIFSNFATMDVLQKAVMEAAFDLYLDFLRREAASGEYPVYKAYGMAYIRFAQEERALFKLLFMCDRQGQPPVMTADREESISMIMQANGLSYARAEMLHLEMWACVHGIATMLVTSFAELDWQLISNMVTDVYQGARRHHMEMEAQQ